MIIYRRSDPPFFEHKKTISTIDALTDAKSLVLYVGAGVTIDKGGPTWGKLIRRIATKEEFRNRNIICDADLDILSRKFTPLESATIVQGYYKRLAGGLIGAEDRARSSLVSALRSHLYPDALWNAGKLIESIALFTLLRSWQGLKTYIITTNYDTFLETEISSLEDEFKKLNAKANVTVAHQNVPQTKIHTLANVQTSADASTIDILYLHGRIDSDARQEVRGELAITEIDYVTLRPLVAEQLSRLFAKSSLLILGSSLTDPPLLSALQETRECQGSQLIRVAVLPIAAISDSTGPIDTRITSAEVASLTKHHGTRMAEFGVSLLTPDFFSQVTQFGHELSAAALAHRKSSYADSPNYRYGARLHMWWTVWYEESFQRETFRRSLYQYLRIVCMAIARDIEDLDGSRAREVLKLEVWARWKPSTGVRRLVLFASSAALWEHEEMMRYADISALSTYSPVEAFIEGRAQIKSTNSDSMKLSPEDTPDEGRWRTFLSVPITVLVNAPLTVGVVTLASMSGGTSTGINEESSSLLESIAERMVKAGKNVLKPRRLKA